MMIKFAEQVPYTRGMDSAPDMKEIFDGISQEYEMCAVYGTKPPAQAVRDAVDTGPHDLGVEQMNRRTAILAAIRRSDTNGYIFVLPYVIFFLAFVAYPLVFSFILMFHRWNLVSPDGMGRS